MLNNYFTERILSSDVECIFIVLGSVDLSPMSQAVFLRQPISQARLTNGITYKRYHALFFVLEPPKPPGLFF